MYISLYGVLWSLGIQYKEGKSSASLPEGVSSIKTFDFSTLYTTLPHDKLKTRLKETIHKAFSHRNYGSIFVVLGYNSTYFSNKIS
jgi:hypothetical protein